jgi:hypothetical protein
LEDRRSNVALQLDWESEAMIEKLGSAIGQDDRQVNGDLERFKEPIESHGGETGARREVEHCCGVGPDRQR